MAVRNQVGQKSLLAVPISVSIGSCLVFALFRCILLVDLDMFSESSDFNHIFFLLYCHLEEHHFQGLMGGK